MIEKDREERPARDVREEFGARQERDVAFYLRREFAARDDVAVFNDLRIAHEGEHAQIDHLVVHARGFVLVESKSIHGEVRVNKEGEWSRSYRGSWSGMPSPVRQVELQRRLLEQYLNAHAAHVLDKIAFGLFQSYFGGRMWDAFCAVSSSAIIHRETMPAEISERIVKSEFVGERLRGVIDRRAVLTTWPRFTEDEWPTLIAFLRYTAGKAGAGRAPAGEQAPGASGAGAAERLSVGAEPALRCRKCGEGRRLSAQSGRYGYFLRCQMCPTNTPMRSACRACGSHNGRVSKSGAAFIATCGNCGDAATIWRA
ncbi:ribosomal protein L40E [Natronocella acetinitrilica]|uniref:Ribosomal protein L40E n=1 Tax=Natronocella acetinitrilica TaxID=414046 RepID=A0AAE3KBZ1_9GAMM|nr:nuclease-related domain-containing protein [Natronocella acetinitrilica]MCP1674298.1 ribosomal protein L40E [Natronocella acetinitrilica]